MAEANTNPAPVKARVIGVTDVGRVREHNEDSFLVMDRDSGKRFASGEQVDIADLQSALVMAVCDGMGGAAAGEVASRMSAERVADVLGKADLSNASPDQIAALMDQAVQQANAEILALAKADQEKKGMGTTLTGAVAVRGRLYVSQVGDSRAYLLRNAQLNQITKDQSLIGQLIEEGTLTEEEAEKYGARNIVLQAVGVEETLRVDTKHWPLLRGDVILVCSDGLSGMVKDARMKAILQEHGEDLRTAADRLILEANDNGGRDNVTVILARFDGEGLRAPMETSGAAGAGEGGLEKAGAEFKAPPAPDVPNPMRKVAIWGIAALALVVALFVVFRPNTANLAFAASPAMHVVLKDKTDGRVVKELDVKDSASIDGLSFGEYDFKATAPGYHDREFAFKIEKSGNVPFEPVHLVPKPVTIVIGTAGPNVEYVIDVTSPPNSELKAFHVKARLPDAGSSREYLNIPAGKMTVVAQRPGFKEHKVEKQLKPETTEKIDIPVLTEVKGELVIQAPPGMTVKLITQDGETIDTRTTGAEPLKLPVRVGEITVACDGTGWQPYREQVTVEEGKSVTVKVPAKPTTRSVSFTYLPNAELDLEAGQPDGSWAKVKNNEQIFFGIAGDSSRPLSLPSGRYRVRDARLKGKAAEFTVPVGAGSLTIKLAETDFK